MRNPQNRNQLVVIFFFVLISAFFWTTRLWRFEQLMTFYSDQALFMNDVWQMVESGKIRLIGPMVVTKIVEGRGFFTGPLFYYFLTPLAILTNWNVILMTKIFMGVWWLAGLGLFLWVGKSKGWLAGLSSYAIFSVFPYYLDFNRFLWNPSLLPFLGIFLFWLISFIYQSEKVRLWFWLVLGIIVGLGINLQYGAFIWGLLVGVFWLYGLFEKRWSFWVIFIFGIGLAIGDFPFIIFEFRHNFYNLSTMFFALTYQGVGEIKGKIGLYHFLFPLAPLIFFGWGVIISFLEKKNILIAIFLTLLALVGSLISIDWQKSQGTGMPKNWNVIKQQSVAWTICQDVGDNPFELASTINGDTRATDLRWWFKRKGCEPMGVEDYESATILYLVAPATRPPEKETVWEVRVLRPFIVEKKVDLGENLFLYKLVRQKVVK